LTTVTLLVSGKRGVTCGCFGRSGKVSTALVVRLLALVSVSSAIAMPAFVEVFLVLAVVFALAGTLLVRHGLAHSRPREIAH
jgi:hypothetical protein